MGMLIFKTKKLRKLFMLLVLLRGLQSHAQPFNYRLYNENDGLPGTFIYNCYQDSRGFLWVCTTAGLSRFDGRHFVNYGLIDGLPDNNITHITEDTTGALWIATRNGLSKYDGNRFYKHPIPHVTSTTFVVQFGLSKQGQM